MQPTYSLNESTAVIVLDFSCAAEKGISFATSKELQLRMKDMTWLLEGASC